VRDCTAPLDRKFVRIVGTFRAATSDASASGSGVMGEIVPLAIAPEE
jgi:hypothetical protein